MLHEIQLLTTKRNVVMKLRFLLFVFFIALLGLPSCSSSRDAVERRNLMMPELSDMPKNRKKFKKVEYKGKRKEMLKRKKHNRRRR